MTSERWRQIQPILHAALELPPQQRPDYLERACAGQPSIRRDVESLIHAAEQAGDPDDPEETLIRPAVEFKPGDKLRHYQITGVVGQGGMGIVYRARDSRLGRSVALKVLPPAYVADPERRRRFLREARAASQLNHANIVTIYDIADEEGLPFIAMELVDGQTLEHLIPLDPDTALEYAIQIATALVKAHAAGITHRDLKPANIMLTSEGIVKVLDFGMAKLNPFTARALSDQTVSQASQTGMILGTPAYMSPEQAEGRIVDAQSDIFSFGVVLYEMLSGERPFRGDTTVATLAATLRDEPHPLHELVPAIWAELEDVVARCLRKDKGTRLQTMAEVRRRLEEARQLRSPTSLAKAPSIAVLPFASMSPDPENEYFSDGLAEEIINALTKLPGVKVTARTSAFAFKGRSLNVSRIAEELKVAHVLEGSVRKVGSRVRVTAQLIAAGDGHHVWSQRFDRELHDIFAIQDEISQAIVDALKPNLIRSEPIVRRKTTNMEAYQSYLEGRFHLNRFTPESMQLCKESFERAIRLDPAFALPHMALGEYYYFQVALHGRRPHDFLPQALAASERALELDPNAADAYVTRALVRAIYLYDWPGSGEDFARALELNPASAVAHYRRAYFFLLPLGRLEEALAENERARELDPLSLLVRFGGANLFHAIGQLEKAADEARAALALFPDSWIGCWLSGMIFANQRLYDEADQVLQRGLRVLPRHPLLLSALAMLRNLQGNATEAAQIQNQLEAMAASRYISPCALYVAYIPFQDADAAFRRQDLAIEERDPFAASTLYNFLKLYPAHPKLRVLLEKMNLSPLEK